MYNFDAADALLHHVYQQTQDAWLKPEDEDIQGGVVLRIQPGQFRVFPYENIHLVPFEEAVRQLNPAIAVKMRNASIHTAIATCPAHMSAVYLDMETQIQLLDSVSQLPRAEKEQCGAFIRDEGVLIVWHDDVDRIVPLCREFDEKLIKMVWRNRKLVPQPSASAFSSSGNLNEKAESTQASATDLVATVPPVKRHWWSWKIRADDKGKDVEKSSKAARPVRLMGPFYVGLGAGIAGYIAVQSVSILLVEFRLDNDYTRFALVSTLPIVYCISLFFCLQLVGNIALIIGPVAQYHENSAYYSAVKPDPNPDVDNHLPHVTIQLPVYKESLEDTIAPSVFSLKAAMQTYARQGGTSSIMVCDDGLQLLKPEEREERIAFYTNHNLAYVARPGHSNEPDGFKRAGRFKKASNLNYGIQLSLCLEKHLLRMEEAIREAGGDPEDDLTLEDKAMEAAAHEIFMESGERFKPWCANGKGLRIGEIILIVDSDTIVPQDCFRDAAREMAECPDVAIIQHESDVMQVAHHYFENAISHFTRRINRSISVGCSNGEVAPFVGHNAFLRWSAVQECAFIDPADGVRKIWSEANVSEDFDMALRLMLNGYNVRWATYSCGGFKEGVSLTVDDELNRWQKYAYGCDEIIFNPLIRWPTKGPINKGLRDFVWSVAPAHYKLNMMGYMFSYYAIAASLFGSILNYLLLGLSGYVDKFYRPSFEIMLACLVVFPLLGNVGFSLLEYRIGARSVFSSLVENLMWLPFFFFFFGGLGYHVSIAILAHLFSYNITWGATGKSVVRSNFFKEVPAIWKRYWHCFLVCFATIIMMIVFTTNLIPQEWRIEGYQFAVIVPLSLAVASHILFPIVLNPWLMIFSY